MKYCIACSFYTVTGLGDLTVVKTVFSLFPDNLILCPMFLGNGKIGLSGLLKSIVWFPIITLIRHKFQESCNLMELFSLELFVMNT